MTSGLFSSDLPPELVVSCQGSESAVSDCSVAPLPEVTCRRSDAGAICQGERISVQSSL